MEEKGVNSSGDTVKGDEGYQMVGPRSENHGSQLMTGSTPTPSSSAAAVAPPPPQAEMMMMKKKKGRPRKDATLSMALSPMPISASIPLSGDYSAWKQSTNRPTGYSKKKHKLEFENPGERMAYSVGGNFTPHVITVSAGEDVTMKIISFAQQGCRAICVLAANGVISNVTLRQPNSSGGTLTYEGRFEILSLTGSFTPSEMGTTKSRSGGMSVSLSGPDGRVIGGGLAGMLVAAAPIQVVVGSFLPGHNLEHHKQPPKKPNIYEYHHHPHTSSSPSPALQNTHQYIPPTNGSVFHHGDMHCSSS
ncbi:hypothetical protein DM860_010880 [Cuscuta australis]|uniref:AT-hook motif nuclear-localized protein n=2 Tax=Cuscuta sect. Cleistogrammica TaxID=1824901 RepID=A0A328E3W7_9ASTE|nr:hypothetical protein DM860_010880 [Cuscuta australis]